MMYPEDFEETLQERSEQVARPSMLFTAVISVAYVAIMVALIVLL